MEIATETTFAYHVRDLIARSSDVREAFVSAFKPGEHAPRPYVYVELKNGQRFRLTVDEIVKA